MKQNNAHGLFVDPELESLIPPLGADERRQLEENIIRDGCREPIAYWLEPVENHHGGKTTVDHANVIVDGHNRFEICMRNDIDFQVTCLDFNNKQEVIEWMVKNQLGKRNLTPFQKSEIVLKYKGMIAEKAKANQATSTGGSNPQLCQNSDKAGKTIDTKKELAQMAGVSHDTIAKTEKVLASADEDTKEKLRAGEMSLNQAHQKVRQAQKNEKKEARHENLLAGVAEIAKQTPDDVAVCLHQSMQKTFEDGVVADCIISDPPYPKEFVFLYGEMARLAKEAGISRVAVMAGQSYLPEIYNIMSEHLTYRWTMAYMTPGGQAVQLWPNKVNTFWKPILIFGQSDEWIGDVATSKTNDNDKAHHHWGQSESGMYDLVKRLTKPGERVFDPFMGAGTTGVAALACGCSFIGCDIDEDFVAKSKKRINNQWEAMQ